MPVFKISGTKLKKLNSLPLDKEENLKALVEANLIETRARSLGGRRI